MVAEVVPEHRRVEAGALLYTSAPVGLFLATFVNFQIAGVFFKGSPETSWRYRLPVRPHPGRRRLRRAPVRARARALAARRPPRARPARASRELFTPENRALTLSRVRDGGDRAHHLVERATPSSRSSRRASRRRPPRRSALRPRRRRWRLVEHWKALATNVFNLGGLIGTLLTIPAAKLHGPPQDVRALLPPVGRRRCWPPSASTCRRSTRLYMYFFIGLTVFGVFGSFTYYLPELFPTRLRGTGAGFCYNVGRVIAAAGPFLVGTVAARGANSLQTRARRAVLGRRRAARRRRAGALALVIETKGRELA